MGGVDTRAAAAVLPVANRTCHAGRMCIARFGQWHAAPSALLGNHRVPYGPQGRGDAGGARDTRNMHPSDCAPTANPSAARPERRTRQKTRRRSLAPLEFSIVRTVSKRRPCVDPAANGTARPASSGNVLFSSHAAWTRAGTTYATIDTDERLSSLQLRPVCTFVPVHRAQSGQRTLVLRRTPLGRHDAAAAVRKKQEP